jgi:hypothetical protein
MLLSFLLKWLFGMGYGLERVREDERCDDLKPI